MKVRAEMVIMLMLCLSLLVTGCTAESGEQISQLNAKSNVAVNQSVKPVVLIIIDSLMDKPLRKAIQDGRAPAMKFLLDNGKYYPQVVSSFPTMSVTIDSTILTGVYADKHHVPGLVWYSGKEAA